MILDVGCGDRPRGDINVDVNVGWNPHTGAQRDKIKYVDPKKIRNFVKASGEHLPFRNDVFLKVSAFAVIKHIDNPLQLLKEMIRVSRFKILLTCPHRFGSHARAPHHQNFLIEHGSLKPATK